MPRWTVALVLLVVLLAAACAPAASKTPTPIAKATAAPKPTVAATQAPVGTPKPAATTPAATPKPAAATSTAPPKAAAKPLSPPATVKIGGTGSLTEAFVYIADAKGYFTEEGLKAEFIRFDSAARSIGSLGTGELDSVGGSPGPGLYNAIARDIPIKIVADRSASKPGRANLAFLVRKDLIDSGAVKDFSDFKGKKIAINAEGTSTDIALEKALAKGNLKRTDVEVVTIGFPDMVTALGSKAIDVAIDVDPFNALVEDQGIAVRWKGEDEVYPNHQTSVLLAGPSITRDNPEVGKRLVVAYIRGIRDYLNAFEKNINKAEMISILTKYTSVKEPALYDKMAVIGVDPDGRVNMQSLAEDAEWYFSKGLMQAKVDLSKVVDNQYVDYAAGRLGKYAP